jgi:hypothetical protein
MKLTNDNAYILGLVSEVKKRMPYVKPTSVRNPVLPTKPPVKFFWLSLQELLSSTVQQASVLSDERKLNYICAFTVKVNKL